MCSIAGIVSEENFDISKMLSLQKHRAPDDEKIFKDNNVKLAMGRLEIIDLISPGLCLYENENYALTYNGEIYNYLELKIELKKNGISFDTNSDTEVVIKSYEFWGVKAFSKFNGMFALAIYDKRTEEILLARDIAGEKPLYYYKNDSVFAFSSEAKAFNGVFKLSENKDQSFFEAFQHCHITTLWNEVNEVPAANYLIYNIKSKKIKIKPHWELKFRKIDLRNAGEELEDLLDRSISIRTRSDVPYGLYFSGGLDSSLISTFHKFDNQYYFDNTIDWETEFKANIKKIAWHLDFPVGSLSSFPLWKLAEEASSDVKVVISGEGADEIFGGYVRYLPVAREFEIRQQFPSYESYLFKKYFKHENYIDSFAALSVRNEKYIETVKEHISPFFEMFDDPVNAMGFADFKLIMPSLLQMGDRMSSSHSLENRCPFLDKNIIEFGFNLPPDYKIKNLEQKIMLRKIAKNKGLTSALNMEKKGLVVVFNEWFNKTKWNRSHYFEYLKSVTKL
jgi:asparagine synthase (glutamine-hydrolysing)